MLRWNTTIDEERHILSVNATGMLTAPALRTLHYEVIALIRWYDFRHMLLNFQQIEGTTLTPEQILDIPRQYDYLDLPRDCKVAIVFPDTLRRYPGLLEEVTGRFMYPINLLSDPDAAWAWLFSKE